jgi:hypothetical protein
MFYTYAHFTPQGKLFYIGKGSNVHRAFYFNGRNSYWTRVVAKYGKPNVKILAQWDTEKEAFEHEKVLISCFRNMRYKLVNLTDGGEGSSGYKQTKEQREKIRLSKLGSKPWNKGIPLREEAKQKLREKSIGKPIHTEEFKERIRKIHTGNKYALGKPSSAKQKAVASALFKGNTYASGNTANRKWVWVGTNIETGNVIRIVGEKNMKEHNLQHANIIKCINGERKSHKGYTWSREFWENKV